MEHTVITGLFEFFNQYHFIIGTNSDYRLFKFFNKYHFIIGTNCDYRFFEFFNKYHFIIGTLQVYWNTL